MIAEPRKERKWENGAKMANARFLLPVAWRTCYTPPPHKGIE